MKKPFEPDDPMELVGVEVANGDPAQFLDDIVQEYLSTGWTPKQIQMLFWSPYYVATHRIYRQLGSKYVRERIMALAEQWRSGWIGGEALSPSNGGKSDASGL